jgi:hypothetical protein
MEAEFNELSNSGIVVPDFNGLEFQDAQTLALRSGLFLQLADQEHPPILISFVMKQHPKAGDMISSASPVKVWVDDPAEGLFDPIITTFPFDGGDNPSDGVQEPRRPTPGRGDDPALGENLRSA